ncbi:MAG: DUF998 domain-containing protein [Candidatus Odinarchaeota archaeon]
MGKNNLGFFPLLLPLSSILIWGSIFISAFLHSSFNWYNGLLSELGVSEVSYIFNSGLIGGGFLGVLFSIFFINYNKNVLRYLIIGAIFFATNISYILAGVFTLSFGFIHYFFAFLAFALSILLCGVMSIIFIVKKNYFRLGVYGLIVLLISLLVWIFINLPGLALIETVVALMITSWFSMFGVTLYKYDS